MNHHKNLDVCDKYLTDKEFLIHMIDHHQVAVDMSNQLMKVSHIPLMIEFARNISYLQSYEIWMMKMMIEYGTPMIYQGLIGAQRWNPNYKIGCYYPRKSEDIGVKCESHFFHSNPKMIAETDDINFLQHMIPHHQLAVNMSKRLLKHTNNPNMMEFANHIIKNQQYEIWKMKELLENLKNRDFPVQFHSSIL